MKPLRTRLSAASLAVVIAAAAPIAAASTNIEASLPPNLARDLDAKRDFINTEGAVIGYATLKQGPTGVLIRVHINGVAPGWHGLHLHQVGDCSDYEDGFKASKGHINPYGKAHGLMHPEGPDLADMPNIFVGENTSATAAFFKTGVAVHESTADDAEQAGAYGLMDSDGFAIVVHENADDHITQPIGGAGPRIACAAFGEK
ncbi:MAG: superoxide dismutase family protein [Pseudomonadota bacterium]